MADPDQDDDTQTGVVIVALPRADDPVQAIGPEQKHATVLYFGDVPTDDGGGSNPNELLTEDFAALVGSVLSIAAATYGPFTEQVTGIEQLGDGGAQVWTLQGTELPDLRADLLDTDSEMVGPLEAVTQYPSYTPHVTIGYEPGSDLGQGDSDEPLADGDLELAAAVTEITFDRLALWWAGEQTEYPLIGTADPGRGSAVAERHRPGGPMSKQLKAVRERGRLVEVASPKSTATRKMIQIITPGWGSSGYYSAEVLERAAKNRVVAKGTQMFLNHASESEHRDRPERDVEKIAAVLVEDAIWDGTRLMAPADLMGPHAEMIESLAPYIGVSIDGSATDITLGEAEGRRGPIIEDLAFVSSVDFVTHAGRGGMVLLESARPSVVNALAVEHGIAEATANETRELLQQELREMFPGDKVWVWVRDFDESTVWYEHETPDDCGTYSLGYSIADNGALTLSGSPVEVRAETNYVPVPPGSTSTSTRTEEVQQMAGEQAGQQTQATEAAAEASTEQTQAPPDPGTAPPAAAAPGAPAAETTTSTTTTTPSPTTEENTMTDNPTGAGATAAPAAQEAATAAAAPTHPREVMEARFNEQGRQIQLIRAGQQAQGLVAGILADGWVAEPTKARLARHLTAESALPLTEAGELDEAELQVRATAALHEAEVEAAETMSAFGFGKVRGLGASVNESALLGSDADRRVNPYADRLRESMKARGMSDAAIEIAVKGR